MPHTKGNHNMLTYEQRLVRGLEALGYWQRNTASGRYKAFQHPRDDGSNYYIFVGPSGALREGPNATHSWALGHPAKQTKLYLKLLKLGTPIEDKPAAEQAAELLS